MSYSSVHRCASDSSFVARVTAAVAQEQGAHGEPVDPYARVGAIRWAVASASDVEAAYESALAAGNPDPGGDPAVVTDGMILAATQAAW